MGNIHRAFAKGARETFLLFFTFQLGYLWVIYVCSRSIPTRLACFTATLGAFDI